MNILLLGGSGLVGQALLKELNLLKIPHMAPSRREVDIRDILSLKRFLKGGSFSHIINAAAYTDVNGAEENIDHTYMVNAYGVLNVAKAAKEFGAKVLHISTDYVFDGGKGVLYLESDRREPCNVYGMSKKMGEDFLMEVLPRSCIIRTSWIFGEGNNFISNMLSLMMRNREVHAVFDQRSKPTFSKDLAEVILKLIDKRGVYHVAGKTPLSWFEISWMIRCLVRERVLCDSIIPVGSSFFKGAKRAFFSALDTSKAERFYRPRPFLEALREFLCEKGFLKMF